MPDIDWNRQHWTASVQLHHMRGEPALYGEEQHGSPESHPALRAVLEGWLRPFLSPDRTVLEIGAGGGRWTRHLLGCRRVYGLDVSAAMLEELTRRLGDAPALQPLLTEDGASIPGVPAGSIDLAFSFDAMTWLELDAIDAYLQALRPLLAPGADVVLHYANRDRLAARRQPRFGDADPRRIELLAGARGYLVARHDTALLADSGLVHLRLWDGRPLPAPHPWRLQTSAPLRVLAWPDYASPEDLSALFARFVPAFVDPTRTTLCLRHDAGQDIPQDEAIDNLQAAAGQIDPAAVPEILLVEDALLRSDLPRLGRAVHGAIALPSAQHDGQRADFLHALQAPVLSHPALLSRLSPAPTA